MAITHPSDIATSPNSADERPSATSKTLDLIAVILMIIGGINWGLVGLFDLDIVAELFGAMTTASRIVYVLVGLAAVYGIVTAARIGTRRTA